MLEKFLKKETCESVIKHGVTSISNIAFKRLPLQVDSLLINIYCSSNWKITFIYPTGICVAGFISRIKLQCVQ